MSLIHRLDKEIKEFNETILSCENSLKNRLEHDKEITQLRQKMQEIDTEINANGEKPEVAMEG